MNTNKKYISITIIVIAIVIIALYFGSSANDAPKKVKIGFIAPLSGQYAGFGDSTRDAALLAAKGNDDIEIIIEDSAFESKRGLLAYQKLTTVDKVDAIINLDSPTINAIQPLLNQSHTLTFQLAEAATHEADSVYQMLPFSYALYSRLGEEADKHYDKVAVVYGNLDVLVTDAEYFKKGISSDQIVYEAKISSDSDMRTEVAKLIAAKPEATTVILDKETGIKFLKVLATQMSKSNIKLICDVNLELTINDYIHTLGKDIFDGCISTNLPNTTSNEFKLLFQKTYGYEPRIFSDYAYDAVNIIKNTKDKPKSTWGELVQKSDFIGSSGPIKFDPSGTRIASVEVHVFKDGKFVKVD